MNTACATPPTVVGAPLVGAHGPVQAGIHRVGTRPTWGKHVTPQPPLSGGTVAPGAIFMDLDVALARPSVITMKIGRPKPTSSSFRRKPESSDRCAIKIFWTPASAGVSVLEVKSSLARGCTRCYPRRPTARHRMKHQQQLAHHRYQRHLARLAATPQAPIELPQLRVRTDRRQRRHV